MFVNYDNECNYARKRFSLFGTSTNIDHYIKFPNITEKYHLHTIINQMKKMRFFLLNKFVDKESIVCAHLKNE